MLETRGVSDIFNTLTVRKRRRSLVWDSIPARLFLILALLKLDVDFTIKLKGRIVDLNKGIILPKNLEELPLFKRIISLIFIFTLSVGINNELLIASAKPTLAFSNVEWDRLKNVADFKLLTPSYSVQSYKLEIKEPYPLVLSQSVSKVRLHFFDESGQTYLFGIEEHKAVGYKINRVVTSIDVRNQTSTTRTIVEDFKFNERGEKININGIEGRFEPWANHIPGGYLRWVQNGTFIEFDSGVLTKEEMVALAKSMK